MSNSNVGDAFSQVLKRKTWEDFFTKTPCVRESYLWGLGCGSLMMAHKLRLYRGKVGHAFTAGMLTFMLVSTISFVTCANEHNRKIEMMKKAFELQGIKNGNKPPPRSSSSS